MVIDAAVVCLFTECFVGVCVLCSDGTTTLFLRTVLAAKSTRKSDVSSTILCDRTFTRSSWKNTLSEYPGGKWHFVDEQSVCFSFIGARTVTVFCILTYTHTHTQPYNGPFSRTTQVSRYHKGKTNLDFTEARDSAWQWHPLGHMQVCTLLQTDNHASTPPLSFYRPDALPTAHPTASKHWRDFSVYWLSVQLRTPVLSLHTADWLTTVLCMFCCSSFCEIRMSYFMEN